MSFTTVTCVYTINCVGQTNAADMATRMSKTFAPVPPEFFTITGATLAGGGSDTTGYAGTQATRTIVFVVSGAEFTTQFPNDEISPFLGLMTAAIEAACNAPVVESQPVGA